MEIKPQCVVALTWTLSDTLGEELDVLDEPVEFLIGGQDLFKKIEDVTELYPEHVVLDANHPLAGIALRLKLRVEGVRDATEEEIGRGTAGTGFFRITPLHEQGPGSGHLH